jgi:hypothetical protein
MMYDSREHAIATWVPPESEVIVDHDDVVVYACAGDLVVLRVFAIGGGFWHVSVDYRKSASEIRQLFSMEVS